MVKFSSSFPCFPSIMDGNSSDNSHSCSEIGGGSWIPTWEHELSSLSGLNLGLGLQGLVDDKEIAARAVAFVVSSTRKGIVPLCADIASLLRSKQCLEKKILMLRNENEMLRSSASGSVRTSQSASPIPASLNSYNDKASYPDDSLKNGDRPSRPCSQCSQCSSNLSTSPKLEKGEGFITSDLEAELIPGQRGITSTPTKQQNGVIAEVLVHAKPSENGKLRVSSLSRSSSGNPPPEITSVPNGDVRKIRPAGKMISRETQCSFSRKRDHAVESKKDSEKQNHSKEKNLADDLGEARKEIEMLKARLKEFEMAQNKDVIYHVVNEIPEPSNIVKSEPRMNPPKSERLNHAVGTSETLSAAASLKPEKSIANTGSTKPKPPPKQSRLTTVSHPSNPAESPVQVLPGCKCSSCQKASGETTGLSPLSKTKPKVQNHKIRINSKLEVKVGDHVLTKEEASGYIQYIGHLDNSGDKHKIYVGLSLDAPGGENDGFIHGKRYFLCQRDQGLFVPLDDIVCSLPSKEPRQPPPTPLSDVTLAADLSVKPSGRSSKKASSGSTQAKLGERLSLMLQKSRKVSDANKSGPAHPVSRTEKNEGPISTSSPTQQSPQSDKRWIGPYAEITRTPREGPVV